MAKVIGKERSMLIAQLAVQIDGLDHKQSWTIADSVKQAEDIFVASEELVAAKYGEYR